jgi:periplasmic copper chaperone A
MIRSSSLIAAVMFATISLGARAADIAIGDPYARAVPPGQPNSAVFMLLENNSKADRALVSAESPAAKTVELHTNVDEGGVMKMRRIDKIDIPAGKTVTLKPGGLHVMLIGLKEALEPGAMVHMMLTFDDGSKAHVMAPARAIATPPKTN